MAVDDRCKRESRDPFNLLELERAVSNNDHADASARVRALVEAMDVVDLQMRTGSEEESRRGFSRWAAAIAALIAAPGYEPSSIFYREVVLRKRVLTDLFAASEYGDMDVMLGAVATGLEKRGECGLTALLKILLSYSLYTEVELNIESYLSEAEKEVADALIGLLATDVVLSHSARRLRRHLSKLIPKLTHRAPPFNSLKFLAQPWFLSSYDDWRDKHEVKADLNKMFRRSVLRLGCKDLAFGSVRPPRDRPTMLVPLERFRSVHAMYRCWAPAIRQLRERFRLIAVCDPKWLDSESRTVFDQVLDLRFGESSFTRCVDEVRELKPDMVYYPSIGMSAEVIALANLRLAPIQVMTFGHPGTAMSDVIDYAVFEELQLGDPALLHETILLLRDGSCQMVMRHDAEPVTPVIRTRANPVRIAVPSTYYKLNPAFLDICRRIDERSRRTVEYHFFPSAIGPRYHHVRRRVRDVLPAAVVYPSTPYVEFVQNLNRCDLQLAPFPFGNANSNLDALRQGIPVLTLEGAEVHSRIDGALLRVLGAPDWLVIGSEEEYLQVALRLIDSDNERVEASRAILDCDLEGAHYDSEYRHREKDFVELFWWLYENHEAIRADGRKVWSPDARSGVMLNSGVDNEVRAAPVS